MIHLSHNFVTSVAILIAILATGFDVAVAQEHFIGEDQPVNRVIQLRSPSGQPVALKTAVKESSRPDQASRLIGPADDRPRIEFDEIEVPNAIQDTHRPVDQEKTPRLAKANPNPTAVVPAVSSYWNGATPTFPPREHEAKLGLDSVQKNTSLLVTEIKSPRYVNVNQTATFGIKIRNQGMDSVENVKLFAMLPAHTKLASSTPTPTHSEGQRYEFDFSRIEAKGVREIRLNLVPTEKKPFEIETLVVVENQQQTSVAVRQPVLSLVLKGPNQTNLGQTVTHELIVTNEGDGVATDIHLDAMFPGQLELLQQSHGPIIPSIEPGESIRVAYQSQAMAPGSVQLKVDAKADCIEPQLVEMDFNIYQPELRISAVGPKLNYLQRDGIYAISIDNTGQVDVTDIQVSLIIPDGMKVTTISRKASLDAEKGILTWIYPKITANSSERIQLKATAISEGVQVCNIHVSSKETQAKEINLQTKVITRADLSVRIKNITGPIQVGGKAEFLVEVENQGTRRANHVHVLVALPESLMPVNNNPVSVDLSENGIAFVEPFVAPGQKVSFKFTAVGVVEGEHVVRSILEADGSERQVISEDNVLVYEVAQARVSESLSGEVPR